MIVHEQRPSKPDCDGSDILSSEIPLSAVTVVITAFDEAAVLPETLQHNFDMLEDLSFILVPAVRSTDGTIELMEQKKRHTLIGSAS